VFVKDSFLPLVLVIFLFVSALTTETSANTTLVINELMANNTGSVRDQNGDADDWIEIYNYGNSLVNIGRMYLTDNQTADAGWRVPDNNPVITTIPPKGFLVIWADDEADEGTLHASFKLGSNGDEVRLFDTDGKTLIDEITFDSQDEDHSYGRIPDGGEEKATIATPTPGRSNASTPVSVIITEIMYHPYHTETSPEDIRQEYIELFNRGAEPVNLSGWRISNGVDFVFPAVTLGAGEYIVVAADVDTFKAVYPSVSNVIGGWEGHLRNKGETIEILDDMGVQVDRVPYADEGDWAVRELGPVDRGQRGWEWSDAHDGGGQSLELINVNMPNEYGQNWAASDVNGVTPGAVNSVADNDVAPFILDVAHSPIIPKDDDTVLVAAHVIDELRTNITVTLHYRIDVSVYEGRDIYPHYDPSTYNNITMFDDGAHDDGAADDSVYGAAIPAQQDGVIIEFFVEARDADSNSRTWPAPSMEDGVPEQVTNALYQVNNSFDGDMSWQPGRQPIYYLIMTEMERARLEAIVSQSDLFGPNSQMNATFISVDGVDIKVRYNLGVRDRGHGTRNDFPNNYRLNFLHDRPWKGVTAVNLNKNYPYYQLAGNKLFQLSGLSQPDVTAVQVRVNGRNLAEPGRLMFGSYAHVEVIDNDFASKHFPDDADGNAYKCMRDLAPADLQYRGDNPDDYRNSYFKTTNVAQDDWSDLMDLCYVMSETPDDIYVDQVKRVANVEEWIRFFALNALLDNSETSLSNGYGDDYFLFSGVQDPRFVLIQHDLDTIFGQGGSATNTIFRSLPIRAVERFLTNPEFIGRYYYHLKDLIETTFSAEQMGPFLDNLLGDFVPPSQIQDMMNFVEIRNQYVLSLIPSELTVETDLPQTNGYYQSNTNAFILNGTADAVKTRSVLVNGQMAEYSPVDGTWEFGNPGGITETLISDGSVWKYLDDGSDQGTAQDRINWFADPAYDDSLWLEGPAELGYGDDTQGRPEATVVNSGPNRNHFITTYFRRSFDVYDASLYSELHLRLLCDDGAVVYLNGGELIRSNLPEGVIDYLTIANINVGQPEEYTFQEFEVDPNLLRTGTNIIAVEIHQASASSADISFDLELNGIIPSGGSGALWPGINRVNIQAFDGSRGMGNLVESEYIDIWYDDGNVSNISGTIASDTLLGAVSGPWHVTGDLIVPAGVTLTIEPGTTLFFDAGTGIIVQQGGRLIAEGTENDRIRLTRVPGSGLRWDGIQFDRTTEDNRLSYVVMEYGDGQAETVNVDHSQLLIDNMTWTRTDKNVIEATHPYLIVSNCVFPDHDDEEGIHGESLTGNEYLLIQANTFGRMSGYQDVIDFTDCHLPGPIIQIYDNVFLGGQDDGLDLDDADACIEGNSFMGFLGGSGTGTSNAIAADQGSYLIVDRNVLVNNINGVLLKGNAQMFAANNTFVGNTYSAIHFYESGSNPGRGANLDGNIFWNNNDVFQNVDEQVELTVNNSILPAELNSYGVGNIDADPVFVKAGTDFHLKPGSPAIDAGPFGLDMGAYVPAGAAVYGEPDEITYHTDATLLVGGPGITHYRYSLNNEPWSEELPVDMPIVLNNLLNSQSYTVYVIGENSAGFWQSIDSPTASRTWTVDTSYSKLVINEVMAINSTTLERGGTYPDLIELYCDGPTSMSLSGVSITDNPDDPRKFVFSAGTSIQSGGYLRLYADSDTTSSGIHLGFALDGDGEGLYLYDSNGQLLDSVEFGLQLPDLSIGRMGHDGQWTLNEPTFGRPNVAYPLGDQSEIKINEWLADGLVLLKDDFIELYNPQNSPVDMNGLYLTDNPITKPDKCPLGPLSFIAGKGFAVYTADGHDRPGHVDFKLSPDTDMIGLFDAGLNKIDMVIYGPQTTDVPYGRVPDGSDSFEFLQLPTPGVPNPLLNPATEEFITIVPEDADKRVLVPTEDIGEDWTAQVEYDDSGWELSKDGPGGVGFERTTGYQDFLSIDLLDQMYATNATCYIRIPFTLKAGNLNGLSGLTLKVRYDDGFVAYLNGTEVARRNFDNTPAWDSRASSSHSDSQAVDFEEIDISEFIDNLTPGDNLLAIHGLNASVTSSDMLISAELDGVVTTSNDDFTYANTIAILNGLRVSELMYHASSGSNYDYIELYNIGETTLDLNGVRLNNGIDFTFGQMLLDPGQYVVVVKNLTAFRSAYGTGINVAGEYSGNLSNGGEKIVLSLPLPLDIAILRFEYSDKWYPVTDGDGSSLTISDPLTYPSMLSEPESWHPATPSPGGL